MHERTFVSIELRTIEERTRISVHDAFENNDFPGAPSVVTQQLRGTTGANIPSEHLLKEDDPFEKCRIPQSPKEKVKHIQ